MGLLKSMHLAEGQDNLVVEKHVHDLAIVGLTETTEDNVFID